VAANVVTEVKSAEITEEKPETKAKKRRPAGQLQGGAAQMALAERKRKEAEETKPEASQPEPVKAEVAKVEETPAVQPKPTEPLTETSTSTAVTVVPAITSAEMEAKLLAQVKVEENELRDLMQQRAQSVQAFLLKTEKVTVERLFIITPKPVDDTYRGESKVNLLLN